MAFSAYLQSKREDCRELVAELGKTYAYVSILGTDVRETSVQVDTKSTIVRDGSGERGFVLKLNNGGVFYEYSLDDISGDKAQLAARIIGELRIDNAIAGSGITCAAVSDEPMKRDFERETDIDSFTDAEMVEILKRLRDKLTAADRHVVNAYAVLRPFTVSKLFMSKNKELSQDYGWVNGNIVVLYNDGKMVRAREGAASNSMAEVVSGLEGLTDKLIDKARHLAKAEPIAPGVYDVITDSSITGLIAHEAFGHGVEMDQFVKERALAKKYMNDYVASPITNMRDGAAATVSAASYFFDDDGVPAHDTQIIKDGILVAGLSDLTSASELSTEPTGNGRRETYKRKAYSRMTNTFFDKGTSKLEDMIASVKHGYMLFETNNGMEDPKNWQIQCTAEYGIEIVDGKLTDRYVSPVVLSGSVPELLKSISMVSDGFKVDGSGFCGKGYKEWVRVADGGPALKVKVKLA